MIVLPTEKRFDWQHAPVMLFAIVLMNVLVFFSYQAGDNQKINHALENYMQSDYLSLEWPLFQQYLEQEKEYGVLADAQALHGQSQFDELVFIILLRQDFYLYLRKGAYEHLGWQAETWTDNRARIEQTIRSTGYASLGLSPNQPKLLHFLTHQFLHGDVMHLLGNLFFLVVCGFAVEAAIGHVRFLGFYLLSGVLGGVVHTLFNLHETIPLVGASGAISGVMAMYLGIFKLKKIEFFYWFFIFVGYFRAPALLLLPVYIGKELFLFYSESGSNIAFMAHAGGFIGGAIIIASMLFFFPKIFNYDYIEDDQEVDPYRQQLATVYAMLETFRFAAAKKELDAMAETYGSRFELALLRINMVKFKDFHTLIEPLTDFFSIPDPSINELTKMEQVWLKYPQIMDTISNDIALRFALNLCQLAEPKTAAKICDVLSAKRISGPPLAVLAQKLASLYGERGQPSKKSHYQHIAELHSAGRVR